MNNIEQRISKDPLFNYFLYKASPRIFPYDFDLRSLELFFQPIKDHLQTGSVVVYYNHGRLSDGPVMTKAMLEKFGYEMSRFGGPVAQKHVDFLRNPLNAFLINRAQHVGIEYLPVVQPADEKKHRYTQKQIDLQNFKLIRLLQEILSLPGGFVTIAPEGIRHEKGLEKPEPGLFKLNKLGKNILYIPTGLIYSQNKTRIVFGEPYTYEGIEQFSKIYNFSIEDAMMLKLAQLLPKSQQGDYLIRVNNFVHAQSQSGK